MIGHLVKKEVAEHWRAFLVIAGLQATALWMFLLSARVNSGISLIEILVRQLSLVSTIGATIAMQALFASEIRNKTILFLEALPISRAKVIFSKLLIAALLIFGANLLSFAFVMFLAGRTEPMELRFIGIVGLKTAAISGLIFALTFLAAMLGRYRYPLYVSLVIAAFLYEQSGGELQTVPPLSLLGGTFATERYLVPLQEVGLVLLISALIVLFGLAVLLLRSGSTAMLLGEKMSHREKVILAGGMIALLFGADFIAPEKIEPPYALTSDKAIHLQDARIKISALPPESAAELEYDIQTLQSSLEPLVDFFEATPPPLFLIHRGDLDGGRFESADVEKREGIVIRANLAGRLPLIDLTAFATARIIDDLTERRSVTERRVWLRDGFALQWSYRMHPSDDPAKRDQLLLRALYAVREGYGPEDIDRWFEVRDALGEPIASALAWTGLVVLEQLIGGEPLRTLLREALEPDPADGLRGWLHSRENDFAILLARHGSIDQAEFLRLWRERLEKHAERLEPALALLPRIEALAETSGSQLSRRISVRVRSDRALETAPIVSVLWRALPALDAPIDPLTLRREERSLTETATVTVPRTFAVGARVFVAGSIFLPQLGCEARFGAARSTVP